LAHVNLTEILLGFGLVFVVAEAWDVKYQSDWQLVVWSA